MRALIGIGLAALVVACKSPETSASNANSASAPTPATSTAPAPSPSPASSTATLPSLGKGDKAPDFKLEGSDGKTHSLADHLGKQAVVVAWFPKAFTGG